MAEEQSSNPIEFVYLGQRMTKTGVLAGLVITPATLDRARKEWDEKTPSAFSLSLEDHIERTASLFKKLSYSVVGGIYTAPDGEIGDDGRIVSIVVKRAKWEGRKYPDPYLLSVLEAAEADAKIHAAALARERGMARHTRLSHLLYELKAIHDSLSPNQRAGFRFMVQEHLTKRPRNG